MDPERWRAVSRRLDEVLDLPEGERTRWLAALREQDPAIADDVRELLEEHESVRRERFLEQEHAFGPDHGADTAANARGFAGRVFGAYRLVSPIGHGGMGVVWLAERCDGAFEQRAAVKLPEIDRFKRSEARFRREATILARVTHPNIAHLIDAGVSPDGQPYLVLEFVDGQPIDRYCDERTLDVPSRIRLILDVLGAVAHAHEHRVVHRDIKPSNVLVRHDGHVKLLDFGIAKLLERDGQPAMASTLTLEHGMALTPAYAAPEQVAGRPVTTATDVYALGLLLYAVLTGQHPYGEASSPAGLFKAIVEVDTPPASVVVGAGKAPEELAALAASRGTTPGGLHRVLKGDLDTIVGKALKKDPKERYASVAELADDLRRYLASEPIRARRDSLARRTSRFARRHAGLAAAVAVGALALAAVAGFYAIRPAAERVAASDPAPRAPVPITSEAGDEGWPSLSPDNTRLAFAWVPRNASSARIAVKTLGSDAVLELTSGTANDTEPVWSPDGQQLAFLRSFREPEHRSEICLVPVTGGPVRVLRHWDGRTSSGLAWWEARNALLFSTRRTETETFKLAALDLATLDVRFLTDPPPAPLLAGPGDSHPTLAPDGRTIAFVRETHEGRDVFLLDPVTGIERQLTRDRHRISGLTWSPDGQAVIMSSVRSGFTALYRVDLADGTIARVPNTADGATEPMAGRGGGLVFSQPQTDSNIYRLDLRDGRPTGAARPIIASSRADQAPHISPDGRRIAFLSTRAGGRDIWVASADGKDPQRLTYLPIASGPLWSPDGQWIAFGALAPGLVRPDIWVVGAAGGTPTRLTVDPSYETLLAWAADSASLYFMSDRSGRFEVWSMPVRGGQATPVTQGGGLRAHESPDGRFLYYANDVPEVWRRPLRTGSAEELILTFPKGTHWGGDWLVGARGLYYLDQQGPGVSVDFLPFGSTGRARATRVTSLPGQPTEGVTVFAVAPDETWLVWAQDDYRNSDIMMIELPGRRR